MAKPTRKKEGLYELSTTVLFWTTLNADDHHGHQKLAKIGGGGP